MKISEKLQSLRKDKYTICSGMVYNNSKLKFGGIINEVLLLLLFN
jgi:hypothetical protein